MQSRSCLQQQKLAFRQRWLQPSPSGYLVPSRAPARARSVAAYSTQGSNDSSPIKQFLEWTGAAPVNPGATEVQMLDQGQEMLALTGNITNWITLVALSWVVVLRTGAPDNVAVLVFQVASQLAAGAQLCWWVLYTTFNWRYRLTVRLYSSSFVLLGVMLPLVACYPFHPHAIPPIVAAFGACASVVLRYITADEYWDKREELEQLKK